MPTYDYRCEDENCKVVQELVQSIHSHLPESLPCPKCGGESFYVWGAPGLMSGNMTHRSFDVAVGRDAESRWNRIHERQAVRDKIRRASGEQALSAIGRNDYAPIKGGKLIKVNTPEPTE